MQKPYEVRKIEWNEWHEGANGIKAEDLLNAKGWGLYATHNIPMGSIVVKLEGSWQSHPSRHSIQIGERHLNSPIGSYVNHHCQANTLLMIALKNLDGKVGVVPWYSKITGTLTSMIIGDPYQALVSTAEIKTGDEITFNYNHSESLLDNPFKCACCGNWIRGRDYIEKE